MQFNAHINIMPLKELLDPQGKAVNSSLHNLGLNQIQNLRVGKHLTLSVEAKDAVEANEIVTNACKKLLANQVMESFEIHIVEAN
jgi:phosphoribosylformylglycinamidine synthase PurS subunit